MDVNFELAENELINSLAQQSNTAQALKRMTCRMTSQHELNSSAMWHIMPAPWRSQKTSNMNEHMSRVKVARRQTLASHCQVSMAQSKTTVALAPSCHGRGT
ncbi:unnamed protein product [Prorocentrum cordatum]|uniref:Uncharacterized protein n=1 Tax=Prorocentrum cordatum TaxID=2364126 RepID=A0ABN9PJ58_9DINO|nr:unnamed protein product [Polarella glacialis]